MSALMTVPVPESGLSERSSHDGSRRLSPVARHGQAVTAGDPAGGTHAAAGRQPATAEETRTFSQTLQATADSAAGGFTVHVRDCVHQERLPPVPRGRLGTAAPEHRSVTLAAGEGFGWLGRPHRLRLTGDGPDARFARDGYGRWVELRRGCGVPAITSLYAREGLNWLAGSPAASRIRVNAMRVGADDCRFEVRDLGGRPARCFPSRGVAVLHWAAFSLEPRLIEYQASAMLAHAGLGHTRRTREWRKTVSRLWLDPLIDDEFKLAWAQAWTGSVAGQAKSTGESGR